MTHPVKTIYGFLVTLQIICLVIFMFYLIDSGFDVTIPINFSLPITDDLGFDFNYTIHFDYTTILAILLGIVVIYIISSLNIMAVGSGIALSDEGSISIKQIVNFIVKFSLLNMPVIFLFSQSRILNTYTIPISLFSLIIYVLNFLIDSGSESANV